MDRSAGTERTDNVLVNVLTMQEFVYKPGYSSHSVIDSSD